MTKIGSVFIGSYGKDCSLLFSPALVLYSQAQFDQLAFWYAHRPVLGLHYGTVDLAKGSLLASDFPLTLHFPELTATLAIESKA